MLDIADRCNELAGKLSLYPELHLVEKIDEWLEAAWFLAEDVDYKSIIVRDRVVSRSRFGDC